VGEKGPAAVSLEGLPPVLLVMGLATHMIGWPDGFCEALAGRGHFVVRFDNRDVTKVRPPKTRTRPGTTKAPPSGAFARCAEEDSNLHPVSLDQALNLVTRVSDASR